MVGANSKICGRLSSQRVSGKSTMVLEVGLPWHVTLLHLLEYLDISQSYMAISKPRVVCYSASHYVLGKLYSLKKHADICTTNFHNTSETWSGHCTSFLFLANKWLLSGYQENSLWDLPTSVVTLLESCIRHTWPMTGFYRLDKVPRRRLGPITMASGMGFTTRMQRSILRLPVASLFFLDDAS